jgi:hypothetical protein
MDLYVFLSLKQILTRGKKSKKVFLHFQTFLFLRLTDLSIIKKKDKMYTFQLIPYSLSILNNQSEPCMCYFLRYISRQNFFLKLDVIDRKKTISANAKIFRKKYNLKASRIACQMLILFLKIIFFL